MTNNYNNISIFSVTASYGDSVIDLSNGATIHLHGDGTAEDRENGGRYVEIMRGIGQPEMVDGEECFDEYESLGWAEMSNAQENGYTC